MATADWEPNYLLIKKKAFWGVPREIMAPQMIDRLIGQRSWVFLLFRWTVISLIGIVVCRGSCLLPWRQQIENKYLMRFVERKRVEFSCSSLWVECIFAGLRFLLSSFFHGHSRLRTDFYFCRSQAGRTLGSAAMAPKIAWFINHSSWVFFLYGWNANLPSGILCS